ncbi:MAG: glycosyltransferase [Oscillospiraceae bacterium]|nr:glycosyltransferase [Oscillospiraceae bacterium]
MFFSIITVTYNAEATIKKTLDSIIMQDFDDYEVVIIDGASSDTTLEIINEYSKSITNYKVLSEKDNGIYDAMNKGISRTTGEYIYFLNAGDFFINENVLSNVAKYICDYERKYGKKKYIFHGDMFRAGKVVTYPDTFKEWKWIYLEHAYFSHQAIFANKNTFNKVPFNTKLKICADRDWLIRTMRDDGKYVHMKGLIIANYAEGGMSSGYKSQQKDSLTISKTYGGKKAYYFVRVKRKIGEILGHER